jgi:hypothetical protein
MQARQAKNLDGSAWTHADEHAVNPACWSEARLTTLTITLSSFALPVSSFLTKLLGGIDIAFLEHNCVPILAAPVATVGTGVVDNLRSRAFAGSDASSSQQQQQQQHQQQHQKQQQQPRGQQQQQHSPAEQVDGVCHILHWLHADRLLLVSPGAWQQHLAQHLPSSSSSSGGEGSSGSRISCSSSSGGRKSRAGGSSSQGGSSSSSEKRQVLLVTDRACDWCCGPMPEGHKTATAAAAAAYGCVSCGAAQYCSRACADAAKKVHAANCW